MVWGLGGGGKFGGELARCEEVEAEEGGGARPIARSHGPIPFHMARTLYLERTTLSKSEHDEHASSEADLQYTPPPPPLSSPPPLRSGSSTTPRWLSPPHTPCHTPHIERHNKHSSVVQQRSRPRSRDHVCSVPGVQIPSTADVAQVHPEPGRRREQQQRGVARRIVSSVGRSVEQLSRLYGYALLISGIDAVFIAGVSALPLTKWGDSGVPRADVVVVSAAIQLSSAGPVSAFTAFHIASGDPFPDHAKPHFCERYAWSGYFAGAVIAEVVTSGSLIYAPLALGLNPRYYLLIFANRLSGTASGSILGDCESRVKCVTNPSQKRTRD